MADMLIKIEADATGWHDNLRCEAPYLRDGWAVVPADLEMVVAQNGGVVELTVGEAPVEEWPEIQDRRTDRSGPYPAVTAMEAGTYVPPPGPSEESLAAAALAQRNQLLRDTDWTQTLDAPIDKASREALRVYRQALRDLPEQEGFPQEIIWPELPEITAAEPDPVDEAFDVLIGGEADA